MDDRECRDALAIEVDRVVTLLRTLAADRSLAARPGVGVGHWTLAEVAVHLTHAWAVIAGLAARDPSSMDALLPGRPAGPALATSVEHLGVVTTQGVDTDRERDLDVLADRLDDAATAYLRTRVDADPAAPRPWLLAGVEVPGHVFTAHLLSETLVHGWDIARAAGRPWRIEPARAALVAQGFLLPVLLAGGRSLFTDPAALAAAHGRYRLDIRGHHSTRIVLDGSGVQIDSAPGRPDCRITMHPVGFVLMFFGRRGPLATVARGHLVPGGRKPWLALRLQAAMPRP